MSTTYLNLHAAASIATSMSEVPERDGTVRVTLALPRRNDGRRPMLAAIISADEAKRVRRHYDETH